MEKKNNLGKKIIKGDFFDANKLIYNRKIIGFIASISIISILSSHSADDKVYRILKLQKDVREFKSEFVDVRTQLMGSRLSSKLQEEVKVLGLFNSTAPPQVISIED
ncbi:MAG: S-adenosyl-methyltransferase [Ichthyobacteriaceae bacterium]|nr:S-adenosyl-methyltransferase [Ichthyobacteriaceae bacterium]